MRHSFFIPPSHPLGLMVRKGKGTSMLGRNECSQLAALEAWLCVLLARLVRMQQAVGVLVSLDARDVGVYCGGFEGNAAREDLHSPSGAAKHFNRDADAGGRRYGVEKRSGTSVALNYGGVYSVSVAAAPVGFCCALQVYWCVLWGLRRKSDVNALVLTLFLHKTLIVVHCCCEI